MKPSGMLAIALIAAGVIALAYQGFTYTTREKVVDVGSIHVMADRTRSIPFSPILGILAIAAGAVLLVAGRRSA
jgi:drug/metabolite transporter (DMT)-like permease